MPDTEYDPELSEHVANLFRRWLDHYEQVERRSTRVGSPRASSRNCSRLLGRSRLDAPSTRALWVYDFRTNQHFTLKTEPLTREHLNGFVARFRTDEQHKREESENLRRSTYEELDARPDFNLDVSAYLEDKVARGSRTDPAA
jgi:hypothetical protein